MKKFLAVIGAIVGVSFLIVMKSVFNGYALSVLWEWFIVPTFGAPRLSVVPAIGLAIVFGYLTSQMPDYKKDKRSFGDQIGYGTVFAILKPSFALLFGWVVHLFM